MATNYTQRLSVAEQIMRQGHGVVAIAQSHVDKIWVKEADYHVPANATDVYVWYTGYTGDTANAAYGTTIPT